MPGADSGDVYSQVDCAPLDPCPNADADVWAWAPDATQEASARATMHPATRAAYARTDRPLGDQTCPAASRAACRKANAISPPYRVATSLAGLWVTVRTIDTTSTTEKLGIRVIVLTRGKT